MQYIYIYIYHGQTLTTGTHEILGNSPHLDTIIWNIHQWQQINSCIIKIHYSFDPIKI